MFKVDHHLYDLSKQMNRFHSFLRHDWNTSRCLKVMSLGEVSERWIALVVGGDMTGDDDTGSGYTMVQLVAGSRYQTNPGMVPGRC